MDFSQHALTQMRTLPNFLGATTIPAHHRVGSDTLEITPAFSILSSSSATLGLRGKGTCCGVKRACGLASGRSWMWYSPARVPRPWKTFENFSWTFSAMVGAWRESFWLPGARQWLPEALVGWFWGGLLQRLGDWLLFLCGRGDNGSS